MKLHKRCCKNQEGKEKMNKKLGVVLAAAMAVTSMTGCGGSSSSTSTTAADTAAATTAAEAAADKAAADGSEAKASQTYDTPSMHLRKF